jgi:hypothetical protein
LQDPIFPTQISADIRIGGRVVDMTGQSQVLS